MSALDARRRQLARWGRTITLRRNGVADLPLLGVPHTYQPAELIGGIQQGDQRVAIGADEVAAAAWPAPPRKPDTVTIDGHSYVVQGATAVYDGSRLIGWNLWVKG